MNRDEERRECNPAWWHQVRSRLARIKVAIAAKDVANLVGPPNIIEQALLVKPPERKEDTSDRAERS